MTKEELIKKMQLKEKYNNIKNYNGYKSYYGRNESVFNVNDLKYNTNGITEFLSKFISLMQEYDVDICSCNGMIESFYIGNRDTDPNSVVYFGASNLWTVLRKDEKELENIIEEAKKEMAEKKAKCEKIKAAIAKGIPVDKKDDCDGEFDEFLNSQLEETECELCEEKADCDNELDDTVHGAWAIIHFNATPSMIFNFTTAPEFEEDIQRDMYLNERLSRILNGHHIKMLDNELSLCVKELNPEKTSYKLELCECSYEIKVFFWLNSKESDEFNKNEALKAFNEEVKDYDFLTNINNIEVIKIDENY